MRQWLVSKKVKWPNQQKYIFFGSHYYNYSWVQKGFRLIVLVAGYPQLSNMIKKKKKTLKTRFLRLFLFPSRFSDGEQNVQWTSNHFEPSDHKKVPAVVKQASDITLRTSTSRNFKSRQRAGIEWELVLVFAKKKVLVLKPSWLTTLHVPMIYYLTMNEKKDKRFCMAIEFQHETQLRCFNHSFFPALWTM